MTRRIVRPRALLATIFPGLERALDYTTKGPLWLVAKYVTPAELRGAGRRKLVRHLQKAGGLPNVENLADAALVAAAEQTIAVPGERISAVLIRELATEALAARQRIARLNRDLEALLESHSDATLIRSLPGMGAVLTAEFIAEAGAIARFRSADALAAAGLAPVLRQSGKLRFLKRPTGGNQTLKRVFYQSAFCSRTPPTAAPSTTGNGRRVTCQRRSGLQATATAQRQARGAMRPSTGWRDRDRFSAPEQ